MVYFLSNICTKNYWNRTTIVEIIVGGWAVCFFESQCICKTRSLYSVPSLSSCFRKTAPVLGTSEV